MKTITTRKLISTTPNPVRDIPNWVPTPYTPTPAPPNNTISGSSLYEIACNLSYLREYPNSLHLRRKPGTVYYIRLTFPSAVWYKLGYTSKSLKTRFYGTYDYKTKRNWGGMGIPHGVALKTIDKCPCHSAYHALQIEQTLHNLFYKDRSYGLTLLANGNSELYRYDILGLDKT